LNVEGENFSRWEIPYFLIRERINPQYILDLGSNIGGSVFFYEHKFPSAQIYACEPLESNFEVLNKNVSNKNTKSLKVGIGDKPGFAAFQIPQKSNYWEATKTEVTQTHESVPILTVEEILDRFEIPKVDILKISIEGDEGLVLLSIKDWSRFDIICISIRTNKNPLSLGQVSEALSNRGYGYDFSLVGSVVWSYPTQYLRE
jgi:FkbM family methyltransferase